MDNKEKLKELRNLLSGMDDDKVCRAFSDFIAIKTKKVWTERYGLKKSGSWDVSLDVLLGKRSDRGVYPPLNLPPGNDHATLWNYGGKPAVYVYQPYWITHAHLMGLAELAKKYGFYIDMPGWANFYYPGQTVFIAIWKDKETYDMANTHLAGQRVSNRLMRKP